MEKEMDDELETLGPFTGLYRGILRFKGLRV